MSRRGDLADHVRATDVPGLHVLPADFSLRHLDLHLDETSTDRLADLLAPVAGDYDVALLDCPPGITLTSEGIFTAADALLVPTIPSALSARTLDQLAAFLRSARGPAGAAAVHLDDRPAAHRAPHRRRRARRGVAPTAGHRRAERGGRRADGHRTGAARLVRAVDAAAPSPSASCGPRSPTAAVVVTSARCAASASGTRAGPLPTLGAMRLTIVRHASAGTKRAWPGPDVERPLDPDGERDAAGARPRCWPSTPSAG